jgi:hypothetical protein
MRARFQVWAGKWHFDNGHLYRDVEVWSVTRKYKSIWPKCIFCGGYPWTVK